VRNCFQHTLSGRRRSRARHSLQRGWRGEHLQPGPSHQTALCWSSHRDCYCTGGCWSPGPVHAWVSVHSCICQWMSSVKTFSTTPQFAAMTAALLRFLLVSVDRKRFHTNRKKGPVVLRRSVYLIGGESVNSISNSHLPLFPLDLLLSNGRVTQPLSARAWGARFLRRGLVGRPWRVHEVTFKCRFSLETVADIFSSGLVMDSHGRSRLVL
jgi:hypothetical protein